MSKPVKKSFFNSSSQCLLKETLLIPLLFSSSVRIFLAWVRPNLEVISIIDVLSMPLFLTLFVQKPVLNRLGDVVGLECLVLSEVGDRARHFEDAVVGAGGELEFSETVAKEF